MKKNYDRDKIILTDCDGVLLNWEYAFHIWLMHRGVDSVIEKAEQYNIAHKYGITNTELSKYITEFNSSSAMGFLPPHRDAIRYVRKLHEEHGYVFHVISAMSIDANTMKLRKMNLNKLFGDTVFEDFTFVDWKIGSKKRALSQYKNTQYYWIEDSLTHAKMGESFGLDSLIMEHKYNMKELNPDNTFPTFPDWKSIYEHITGV